ncbi:hypothetical protein [Piscibacillus salipiscarius]
MDFRLQPLGDQAVVIELGQSINIENHQKLKWWSLILKKYPLIG